MFPGSPQASLFFLTPLFCYLNVFEREDITLDTQCEVTYGKYALKQGNRIGVHFIKYDIQGVFLKCTEILPTRLFDNVKDQKQ
jgi:hypothetical protein